MAPEDLADPDKVDKDPPLPAEILALDGEELGKVVLTATFRRLLQRITNGTATAAELNVARAACKDQGIQMRKTKASPAGQVASALQGLPFAGPPPGSENATH